MDREDRDSQAKANKKLERAFETYLPQASPE